MQSRDRGGDIAARALRAFELTRVTGAPWFAGMMGVEAMPTVGPATHELRCEAGDALGSASLGLLDIAMLADLALGAALRSRLGAGRPLPTLTLTLELDPVRLPTGTSVRGWSEPVTAGLGRTYGVILHEGRPIGRCLALFAVAESAPDLAPMPWETPGGARSAEGRAAETLSETERAMLAALPARGAPELGKDFSWTDALLAAACTDDPDMPGDTLLSPNAAMLNRSGQVQGGVLFWLAATAALAGAAAGGRPRLVSGRLQFLSAARPVSPLSASPTVTHVTRRTSFARTEIQQDGRPVASGEFVFRNRSGDKEGNDDEHS
ncbi:hypothetical protein [Nonomuraea sp. B19D2]|uniref:PaaI family thioesterase n=1 Tax=Nonomuraea sp. B19D2 TaxID=3159561 RepID=UPI0032DA89E3